MMRVSYALSFAIAFLMAGPSIAGSALAIAKAAADTAEGKISGQHFSRSQQSALRSLAAEYAKLSAGFAAGDVRPILDARTKDFVTIAPNGEVRDAAYSAEVARRFFTTSKPPYSVQSIFRCARFPDQD